MVTTVHTELESLRRMHAQDLVALQAAADLIAKQQVQLDALKPEWMKPHETS